MLTVLPVPCFARLVVRRDTSARASARTAGLPRSVPASSASKARFTCGRLTRFCTWARAFVASRGVPDARRFLRSLIGRSVWTVAGRENRVLGFEGESVRVRTRRSPSGQLLPIAWVQQAMDRIEGERAIEISVQSGRVSERVPRRGVAGIAGRRGRQDGVPAKDSLGAQGRQPQIKAGQGDLVGVREAQGRSPLWVRRRAYAEASGHAWLILSAMHGLVDPDSRLDSYELALTDLSAGDRRAWGEGVVRALDRRLGDLTGAVFEVHAGESYRRAIEPGVIARGGELDVPLRGLPLGAQLAWYKARSPRLSRSAARRGRSTAAEFETAIDRSTPRQSG